MQEQNSSLSVLTWYNINAFLGLTPARRWEGMLPIGDYFCIRRRLERYFSVRDMLRDRIPRRTSIDGEGEPQQTATLVSCVSPPDCRHRSQDE